MLPSSVSSERLLTSMSACNGVHPSRTLLFYDEADFREGGKEVFGYGTKNNPQYLGVTTYHDSAERFPISGS